jgi:hypothetical protein
MTFEPPTVAVDRVIITFQMQMHRPCARRPANHHVSSASDRRMPSLLRLPTWSGRAHLVPSWGRVAASGSRVSKWPEPAFVFLPRTKIRLDQEKHSRTSAQDDCSESTGSQGSGDRRQSRGTGKRAPAGSFGARVMAREELQASQICGYCGGHSLLHAGESSEGKKVCEHIERSCRKVPATPRKIEL